jgi:hypothetical protein
VTPVPHPTRGWARLLAALCLGAGLTAAQAQDAAALAARHTQLLDALAHSPFRRPLVLQSEQNSGDLRGDVYAEVGQPMALVLDTLQRPTQWCELLMLHLNVKDCAAGGTAPHERVDLVVGRKYDQPPAEAYHVTFDYSVATTSPEYLRVQMTAPTGPMGTRDYHLALEAMPLDPSHTFVHMTYAYGFGMAARVAMQGYLMTIGRDKVGFSVVDHGADGAPVYIGGVRGVIERNTMRYYLAIDTYLADAALPSSDRLERRLADWFAAVERYPVQLHEMDRAEYMDMKHHEFQRMQSTAK